MTRQTRNPEAEHGIGQVCARAIQIETRYDHVL